MSKPKHTIHKRFYNQPTNQHTNSYKHIQQNTTYTTTHTKQKLTPAPSTPVSSCLKVNHTSTFNEPPGLQTIGLPVCACGTVPGDFSDMWKRNSTGRWWRTYFCSVLLFCLFMLCFAYLYFLLYVLLFFVCVMLCDVALFRVFAYFCMFQGFAWTVDLRIHWREFQKRTQNDTK